MFQILKQFGANLCLAICKFGLASATILLQPQRPMKWRYTLQSLRLVV